MILQLYFQDPDGPGNKANNPQMGPNGIKQFLYSKGVEWNGHLQNGTDSFRVEHLTEDISRTYKELKQKSKHQKIAN